MLLWLPDSVQIMVKTYSGFWGVTKSVVSQKVCENELLLDCPFHK